MDERTEQFLKWALMLPVTWVIEVEKNIGTKALAVLLVDLIWAFSIVMGYGTYMSIVLIVLTLNSMYMGYSIHRAGVRAGQGEKC